MSEGTLRYETKGAVAVLTIDNPARMNALDEGIVEGLRAAWKRIDADPGVRAAVLTGSGDRAFCSGMDLAANVDRGGVGIASTDVREATRLTALQNDVWVPVVLAVNGVCAGAGLHFVADADVVVASERASFVDTHVTVGQVAALEPIGLLHRIGVGNALSLTVLGRAGRVDADQALRISLADRVVRHEELLDHAITLASAAASGSPEAIRLSKKAIWQALERPYSDALQHGWDLIRSHWSHPDCSEGPGAFIEKREPLWQS